MSWQVKQKINFYSDEFRPPELPADVHRLLSMSGYALLMSLGLAVVLLASEWWLARELQQSQEQVAQLNLKIEDEQRNAPPLNLDPQLEAQQALARANLLNTQRVLNYLSRQNIEERLTFTPLLQDLGNVAVEGVWLSAVDLSDQGRHVQLRGHAIQASLLSPYIAELSQQPAYVRRGFGRIEMTESDQGQKAMYFILDTRTEMQQGNAVTAGGGL